MLHKRYIGLSLSLCLQDILRNRIGLDEIVAIVAASKFNSKEEAFEAYYQVYWAEYAPEEECRFVLNEVWKLVFQPRLVTNQTIGHIIARGFWLDTFTGELKKHFT